MSRLWQSASSKLSSVFHPTVYNKNSIPFLTSQAQVNTEACETLLDLFTLQDTLLLALLLAAFQSLDKISQSVVFPEDIYDPQFTAKPLADIYGKGLCALDNYGADPGVTAGVVSLIPPADKETYSYEYSAEWKEEIANFNIISNVQHAPSSVGPSQAQAAEHRQFFDQVKPWQPEATIKDQEAYLLLTKLPALKADGYALFLASRKDLIDASKELCQSSSLFGHQFNHSAAHDGIFMLRTLLNVALAKGALDKITSQCIFEFVLNLASLTAVSRCPAIYVDLLAPFLLRTPFEITPEKKGVATRILADLQLLFGYIITCVVSFTDLEHVHIDAKKFPEAEVQHRCQVLLCAASLNEFTCNSCSRAIYATEQNLPCRSKVGKDHRVLLWTTTCRKPTPGASIWSGITIPGVGTLCGQSTSLEGCFYSFHLPLISDAARVCAEMPLAFVPPPFTEPGHFECKVVRKRDNIIYLVVTDNFRKVVNSKLDSRTEELKGARVS